MHTFTYLSQSSLGQHAEEVHLPESITRVSHTQPVYPSIKGLRIDVLHTMLKSPYVDIFESPCRVSEVRSAPLQVYPEKLVDSECNRCAYAQQV